MSNEWIKTDDLQFVKKITETEFKVVEIREYNDKFATAVTIIDLEDYTEQEILDIIKTYSYLSIKELRKMYGEATNQIIAECCSEDLFWESVDKDFNTMEEVQEWLLKDYEIVL